MDKNTSALLAQAKQQIAEDMKSREIGAIIWSIADAGFHYIPAINIVDEKGNNHAVRVTGLYNYNGTLFAIEEDVEAANPDNFYTPGVDVPPVVVTLTEAKAKEHLGDPENEAGFTSAGTLEEWVAIADCYFEALRE